MTNTFGKIFISINMLRIYYKLETYLSEFQPWVHYFYRRQASITTIYDIQSIQKKLLKRLKFITQHSLTLRTFFYQFKIGLSILERIWADCQAIIVCYVSKQIWMRSLLVQSYCNRCVSEEVNLPTVSLLSRACLFKILYLSAKRNFHVLFFLSRSFPLNDVHAFKEIFLKCVYLISCLT